MALAEGLRRIGVDARSFAYRVDWDGREDVKKIDTDVCKVSLLTGSFKR